MKTTIMFDLDGTLLPMDTDTFVTTYMKALAPKLSHLFEPKQMFSEIMTSTYAMVKNTNRNKTNQEVFVEDFFGRNSHLDPAEVMPIFDKFYSGEFKSLCSCVNYTDECKKIVPLAVSIGFDVIIATNPIFPMTAIKQRLVWIDADKINHLLITAYENMHFCKPNIEYYKEILEITGKKPEECVMIGNDVEEDMVASKLGITTFLVKDYLIHRGSDIKPDYEGSLTDAMKFIESIKREG